MKKIKFINLINCILLAIIVITDIVLGFVFKADSRFYYSTVLCLAISGLVNLGFILIKELAVLAYDSKKYHPIMFGAHIFIGVLCYYLIKNLKGYNEYWYLYWTGLAIGIVLPIVIVYFLEKRNNKKSNTGKPKFIVNKR